MLAILQYCNIAKKVMQNINIIVILNLRWMGTYLEDLYFGKKHNMWPTICAVLLGLTI
jgi:hypothetical protein